MNFIALSDSHLLWHKPQARIDDIRLTQWQKWSFMLQYATDTGSSILEAGDFFNANRSWYLLPEIMDLLKKYGVPIYCVFGQHDTYLYNEKTRAATSLGILEKAGMVKILDDNPTFTSSPDPVVIYGSSFGQSIHDPKSDPPEIGNFFKILVIHASIAEFAMYPNQKYMDALTFLKDNPFGLIVAGDIHQKFIKSYDGRYIVNSGPLIRKEATAYNFNHHPGFFTFNTNTPDIAPQFIEVPHRPAEEVLTRSHIEYEKEADSILDSFISAVENPEIDDGVEIVENIWAFVKKNNIEQSVVDIIAETINKHAGREEV